MAAFLALAILLGGQPQVVAGADKCLVERHGLNEGSLGIGGHDAVRLRGQGLAKIGFTFGALAEKPQRVAPGGHRVRVTAETHIDRGQNLPATTILRIALKMFLGLGNQAFDRLLSGRDVALGPRRLGRQFRRSKPKVKASGDNRHRQQRRNGSGTSPPCRRRCIGGRWCGLGGVGGGGGGGRGKQAPGDFHTRRLRLGLADEACRQVAFDLVKLIAIDRNIAARARRPGMAGERPDHGKYRCRRHQRQDQP